MGCQGMPKGAVMFRMSWSLNLKEGAREGGVVFRGELKKTKSSTHLTIGSTSLTFSIATVASAMLPCIPLAIVYGVLE